VSEDDYQRGLRGGDCLVTFSEWERFSDWKAGYDEYERRLQKEIASALSEGANARAARANRKFECPFCLEPALRDGASRCPVCRSDIPSDYWPGAHSKRIDEDEAEREAEEEAYAEFERSEAAHTAQYEADEAERSRRATAAQLRANASKGCVIGPVIGGVIGAVLLAVAGCESCVRGVHSAGPLLTAFNALMGMFYGATVGAIVGPLVGIAIADAKQ
jgi:uncharacterized Zn finger protein (UPF0148 family)